MELIRRKIRNLVKKIRHWEYMYYFKNISEVSDIEYDTVLEELYQLELKYPNLVTHDSPTQSIGNIYKNGFRQVNHQVPMLSLNRISHASELLLFDKRIRYKLNNSNHQKKLVYCCELKLDGVAVSLLYKKGKLIQAATRGNGRIGEDVTRNVYTISSIPKYLKSDDNQRLPHLLEIRGEIFISKLCFLKLNQTMQKCGKKSFSNSRNAASGSLRQLDPKITKSRPLMFYCYGISFYLSEQELPNSHWERLQLCNNWGLLINRYMQLAQDVDEVFQYYDYVKKIRSNLRYNIDGIVIKIDNCIYQNNLGYSLKAPYWAIAYKFPAELKSTIINNVVFRVGRTGLITPIIYVNPIIIGNVIIKKVSVHNINEIKRLNLMIGDMVLIQRSGDVIPKILKVVISNRSSNNLKFIKLPDLCPVCCSVLEPWNDRSSVLRCPSRLTCLAQRKAILKHFVSRKAMNIRGMGEKIIDQLIDKNLICTPVDIFYLNKEKLLSLDRYGVKSIDRLLRSISISKKTNLAKFIYALGIPSVGESVSNNLAFTYKTIEALIKADFQSLLKLQYIGKSVATKIHTFLNNPNNLKNIQDLINSDIRIR